MNAQILYLGHAGFLVEMGDTRLACDPWFNGAFYDAWYPRPYNRHLQATLLQRRPTHLYISHSHEDHYDARFLREIAPDTVIIAPAFADGEMQKLLSRFKHVMYLDNRDMVDLPDFAVQMYLDVTTGRNDSALLMHLPKCRILNLNDCYIEPDAMPACDMLWGQFSGAIHYPHAYDFAPNVQQSKVAEFKQRAYKDVLLSVQRSGCSTFVPSAGPPCFLDPAHAHLNDPDSTIFFPWSHVASRLAHDAAAVHVLDLAPGDTCHMTESNWRVERAVPAAVTVEQYRAETAAQRLGDYDAGEITPAELETYFKQVRANHLHVLATEQKCFYLVLQGQTFLINLSSAKQTVFDAASAPAWLVPNYTLWIPTRIMRTLMAGGRWEAALLSGRIRLHRDEDVYDTVLFKVLYNDFSPEKTQALARHLKGDVKIMERDGYLIQRFCPHSGADLKNATIAAGVITCPRHLWQWDLASGECLKGGNIRLVCQPRDTAGKPGDDELAPADR